MHQHIIMNSIILSIYCAYVLYVTSIPVSPGPEGQRKKAAMSRTLANSICLMAANFSLTGKIQKPVKNKTQHQYVPINGYSDSIKWTNCRTQDKNCKKFSITQTKSSSVPNNHSNNTRPIWARKSSRIFGGVIAHPNEYPWAVEIILEADCSHRCGGTLLNTHTILSAAHCFHFIPAGIRLVAVAGEHIRSIDEHIEQYRIIRYVTPHPSFTLNSNYNRLAVDMAIFHVDPPFIFNQWVYALSLIKKDPGSLPPVATSFTIVGWGFFDKTNSSSDVLYAAKVPLLLDDDCKRIHLDLNYSLHLAGEFCTGVVPGTSFCRGDSGGGLILEDGGLPWLAGVAVSIQECGVTPGVYANVFKNLHWIQLNM